MIYGHLNAKYKVVHILIQPKTKYLTAFVSYHIPFKKNTSNIKDVLSCKVTSLCNRRHGQSTENRHFSVTMENSGGQSSTHFGWNRFNVAFAGS